MSGVAPAWATLSREERVATVAAMIARKMSRSEIGEALGVSRNTICGFCARHGLAGGQPARKPAPKGAEPGYGRMRPRNDGSAAGGHATRKPAAVTLAGGVKVSPSGSPRAFGAAPSDPASPGHLPRKGGGVAAEVVTAGETATPPPAGGVGFFDLKADHCRRPLWGHVSRPPLDQMRFCGAPVEAGTSWCRACGLKMTAPTPGLIRRRAEAERETRANGAVPSDPAAPGHLPRKGGGLGPANPTAHCPLIKSGAGLPTAAPAEPAP